MSEQEMCRWHQEDDEVYDSMWDTDCKELFQLNDGTPKDNRMAYCCYCGKPLEQVLYVRESSDE